jgi:peroxiredoxin Q/BCP
VSNPQPIEEGQPAPELSLPASTGETYSLADYRGERAVVLYFYPKDDTPGCTTEACAFRDLAAEFAARGAVILGVSPDSVQSHQKFSAKHGLPFPLLSDPDAAVATRYGVWKEKTMYGRTFMGVERTTVVIDKDGTVRRIFPTVRVDGHADAVLAALEES